MKDYIKVIVTVVITFLATSFLNAVVNKSNATHGDLIMVKTEAFDYTDKQIHQHEKLQAEQFTSIKNDVTFIKEYSADNKKMLEKLLDYQLNKGN